jgi:AraC-like DNA-binding protein
MTSLYVSQVQWLIPLDEPPQIRQMGIGFHGQSSIERYYMQDLWCIHLYHYNAQLSINEAVFPIQPGAISITPPGAILEYRYRGQSVHAYAHFVLPDTRANTNIAAMQHWDAEFTHLNTAMEHAIGSFVRQPARAAAKLWEILWQLVESEAAPISQDQTLHPAVAATQHTIELRLAEPISVAELARRVNLSHNHLTRLFQAQLSCSIAAYIRRRRMERAQHLLTQTTLPIKAIAAQVGVHDLHAFNKAVRRELGASPRGVRERR